MLRQCQVAAADIILLNKTEGLDDGLIRSHLEALSIAAPSAVVLATAHCAVPANIVLDGSRSAASRPHADADAPAR